MAAGLDRIRRQWERLGTEDPLWSVLTQEEGRRGGWDEEAFFESGREHVRWVFQHLEGLGIKPSRHTALDFGCGVGRLTAALADHVEHAHGVDVSSAMIAEAEARHGGVATFHLNDRTDLSLFDTGSVDVVVSVLVLQHMPNDLALGYVREFVRVLSPGGAAVFQAPEALHRATRATDPRRLGWRLRNVGARLKGQLLRRPVMEMHMLSRAAVEEAVQAAGGHIVEAVGDDTGGDFCLSVRYVVVPGREQPHQALPPEPV